MPEAIIVAFTTRVLCHSQVTPTSSLAVGMAVADTNIPTEGAVAVTGTKDKNPTPGAPARAY